MLNNLIKNIISQELAQNQSHHLSTPKKVNKKRMITLKIQTCSWKINLNPQSLTVYKKQ